MNAKIDTVKAELQAELRTELAHLEKRLTARMGQMGADYIKWSFVFWVAAIAAIVGLR